MHPREHVIFILSEQALSQSRPKWVEMQKSNEIRLTVGRKARRAISVPSPSAMPYAQLCQGSAIMPIETVGKYKYPKLHLCG